MPRDFPHDAMLDGRRKDTKDLHSFPYRSRLALRWLAFVLRRWHPRAAFPCKHRTGTARVVEKNLSEVLEGLCARPITLQFSGHVRPRSLLGSRSHDASDSRLAFGASLVRAIPKLGAGPEGPNTVLGSSAELSFSSSNKVSSHRPAEQCPDQTKCFLPQSQRT